MKVDLEGFGAPCPKAYYQPQTNDRVRLMYMWWLLAVVPPQWEKAQVWGVLWWRAPGSGKGGMVWRLLYAWNPWWILSVSPDTCQHKHMLWQHKPISYETAQYSRKTIKSRFSVAPQEASQDKRQKWVVSIKNLQWLSVLIQYLLFEKAVI